MNTQKQKKQPPERTSKMQAQDNAAAETIHEQVLQVPTNAQARTSAAYQNSSAASGEIVFVEIPA